MIILEKVIVLDYKVSRQRVLFLRCSTSFFGDLHTKGLLGKVVLSDRIKEVFVANLVHSVLHFLQLLEDKSTGFVVVSPPENSPGSAYRVVVLKVIDSKSSGVVVLFSTYETDMEHSEPSNSVAFFSQASFIVNSWL